METKASYPPSPLQRTDETFTAEPPGSSLESPATVAAVSGAFLFRVVQCRLHLKERTPTQEATSVGKTGALNKVLQRFPLHLTSIGISGQWGKEGVWKD